LTGSERYGGSSDGFIVLPVFVRYGGRNVNFVGVFVLILVSRGSLKIMCFQAYALEELVESLNDCEKESVQLRDLVPGAPRAGGERFQQAGRQSRQGRVILFKERQVADAEAIAFGSRR
jgi:hypothetical protein